MLNSGVALMWSEDHSLAVVAQKNGGCGSEEWAVGAEEWRRVAQK
jgi:hypothetical protein